ncbi:hypothetical protein D3C80_1415460 [compost metagenome]
MGDYNRRPALTLMLLKNIVSKALGSSAHSVTVHPVAAGADYSAQTACTEFKVSVKAFLQLLRVICQKIQLLLGVLINRRVLQPASECFCGFRA